MQPRRARRVAGRQALAQRRRSDLLQQVARRLPHLGRHVGDRREALHQRAQIKSRAAAQDRQLAGLMRGIDLLARERGPAVGRAHIVQRQESVEPVRRRCHCRCARLRGQDRQLAIDLHGIGIDDDAAEVARQPRGERGLAAGGRAGNDQHRLVPLPCLAYTLARHDLRLIAHLRSRRGGAYTGPDRPGQPRPRRRRRARPATGLARSRARGGDRLRRRRCRGAGRAAPAPHRYAGRRQRAARRRPPQDAVAVRHGCDRHHRRDAGRALDLHPAQGGDRQPDAPVGQRPDELHGDAGRPHAADARPCRWTRSPRPGARSSRLPA